MGNWKLKPGVVVVATLHPDVWPCLDRLAARYAERDFGVMVVTSALDPPHSTRSEHWARPEDPESTAGLGYGNGFDLRFWSVPPEERESFGQDLDDAAGPDFRVIVENDHYHVDRQPGRASQGTT